METIRGVVSLQRLHLAIGTTVLDELARPEGGVDHNSVEETEDVEKVEENLVPRDCTVVAFAQFGNPISRTDLYRRRVVVSSGFDFKFTDGG